MKNLKKNNGISLIKIILLILFTILVVLFAYVIIKVDVLEIEEGKIGDRINIVRDWAENLIRKSRKCNRGK